MTTKWLGGFVRGNPTAPTASAAPGIWTKEQAAYYRSQSLWPVSPGQQAYTSIGLYSWVAPTGVTSVSVVCVGSGSGSQNGANSGAGGALSYTNNITVVPGTSYTVRVANNTGSYPTSYFDYLANGGTSLYAGNGSNRAGTGGGNGGNASGGGGGAGGYTGSGGNGGNPNGASGSGGGGGGGGYAGGLSGGYGGGGVGILGRGNAGAGGSSSTGKGGSGGADGQGVGYCCCYGSFGGSGGLYGGGSGQTNQVTGEGGRGAVRIIWPGNTRSFPDTNTGDL
jgi:hypothetical protein